jgi:hypothetical protein
MGVSVKMMTLQASKLKAEFCHNTDHAKGQSIGHFLLSNQIGIQYSTHESQKSPREMITAELDFIHATRPLFSPKTDTKIGYETWPKHQFFYYATKNNVKQYWGQLKNGYN